MLKISYRITILRILLSSFLKKGPKLFFAVVLHNKAVLFVDGRYTLQARQQVNTEIIEICPIKDIFHAKSGDMREK